MDGQTDRRTDDSIFKIEKFTLTKFGMVIHGQTPSASEILRFYKFNRQLKKI